MGRLALYTLTVNEIILRQLLLHKGGKRFPLNFMLQRNLGRAHREKKRKREKGYSLPRRLSKSKKAKRDNLLRGKEGKKIR